MRSPTITISSAGAASARGGRSGSHTLGQEGGFNAVTPLAVDPKFSFTIVSPMDFKESLRSGAGAVISTTCFFGRNSVAEFSVSTTISATSSKSWEPTPNVETSSSFIAA